MITSNAISASSKSTHCQAEPHGDFLLLKAKIERHANITFRNLPTVDREDATAAAVAAAFQSFVRLKARGQNPIHDFPTRMAIYGVMYVRGGRHTSSRDVLSQRAQRMHRFSVQSLTRSDRRSLREPQAQSGRRWYADAVEELLFENTRTPPDVQATFRIDFSNWLASCSHKDQQLIHELSLGERTSDLAMKYNVTPGRVSQKRRQLHREWLRFCDELPVEADVAIA